MKLNLSGKKWLLFSLALCVFFFLFLYLFKLFAPPQKVNKHITSHLKNPVSVSWDLAGVPQIRAELINDAYFVQGYITARDRFFQLDLTRRKMSGKLTELFGEKAFDSDYRARQWNFLGSAFKAFELMSDTSKQRLISFSKGINAYLADHGPSWEYILLKAQPSQWTPEDSFLVVLSMFDNLNRHESQSELAQSILKKNLSQSAFQFFFADWGFFDSPIIQSDSPLPKWGVPSPSEFKVTSHMVFEPDTSNQGLPGDAGDRAPGSNAWVVDGSISRSGKPLLASDPHLDLRVPNLWYRVEIITPELSVRGMSIPGLPGVVIGRNKHLAWSFTNSSVDNSDRVLLPPSLSQTSRREEIFRFKNGKERRAIFLDSPWGPVFSEGMTDPVAIQWSALDPETLKTLDLTPINLAQNKAELIEAAKAWAGPAQNLIFASKEGDIGWTLVGKVPQRVGFDGTTPKTRNKDNYWSGYFSQNVLPIVINPDSHFIVSANQRSVPIGPSGSIFGHHWPNAARSRRISNRLIEKNNWHAREMISIQNDTLSLTHQYYRDELVKCLKQNFEQDVPIELQELSRWDGYADTKSVIYPFLRSYRFKLIDTLVIPIADTISSEHRALIFHELGRDELVKRIIDSNQRSILAPQFTNVCEAVLHAFRATLSESSLSMNTRFPTWGELNQSKIQHPFSRVLPSFFKNLLDYPSEALSGDYLVPRVMTPTNGASMRLIIDLGNPNNSLFIQPGGQSNHPLSSHYKDLYPLWVKGEMVPFEATKLVEQELFVPLY